MHSNHKKERSFCLLNWDVPYDPFNWRSSSRAKSESERVIPTPAGGAGADASNALYAGGAALPALGGRKESTVVGVAEVDTTYVILLAAMPWGGDAAEVEDSAAAADSAVAPIPKLADKTLMNDPANFESVDGRREVS